MKSTLPARILAYLVAGLLAASAAPALRATPVSTGSPQRPPAATAQAPTAQASTDDLAAGHAALAAGDIDAALAAFKRAHVQDTRAPGPLLGLAEVARLTGDKARAEQFLRQAIDAAPGNAEVQRAWGRLMFAEGKYPAAETALLEAAKLDPKDARTFLDLGELYLQGLGRPVDAERAFRRAVEFAPQHAGARHGLGMSLAASRRFTEAVVELKESARLSPGNPVPLVSLGKVYLVQGKPDAALEAFESASRIAPDLVAAFEGAGDACMQKKDYVRAEARYAQVVDRAPGDAGAQFKHGNALLMLERWSDAEAAFLLAVKADKAHAAAYNNLAWILLQREERSDQALEWARQAVELQPAQPAFQDTLGMVHLMRAEPDAAVAALRRASASTPPVASYIYHLGLALEARGAGKEAVLEYRRALQIDPRFADAADAKRRIAQPGP